MCFNCRGLQQRGVNCCIDQCRLRGHHGRGAASSSLVAAGSSTGMSSGRAAACGASPPASTIPASVSTSAEPRRERFRAVVATGDDAEAPAGTRGLPGSVVDNRFILLAENTRREIRHKGEA